MTRRRWAWLLLVAAPPWAWAGLFGVFVEVHPAGAADLATVILFKTVCVLTVACSGALLAAGAVFIAPDIREFLKLAGR